MDFNELLKQAQKMQEDMYAKDRELKEKTYASRKARNIVEITMNGAYEITELKINDDFARDFTFEDKEILEDAILLAVNELTDRILEDQNNVMGDLAGGLGIPGLR